MLTLYNTRIEFDEATTIAVLPIGALEQHGSHLPVGTDTIIAEELSRRVAKRLDAYLLPAVGISSSIEHREAKGTVYLKSDTLALVIRDIAVSLQESGFKRLVIVNGHGGNWILKPTIRQLNRDLNDFMTILVHTNVAQHRQHEIMEHAQHDIHAGEKETSLILYLNKEHVKSIVRTGQSAFYPQDYMDYLDNMRLTEDGYWGYPEQGTETKGEQMIELLEECALAYIADVEKTVAELGDKG